MRVHGVCCRRRSTSFTKKALALWLAVSNPQSIASGRGALCSCFLIFAAEYEFYQFRAPGPTSAPTTERNSSSTATFLQQNPVNSLPPLTEGMFGYSLTRPVHNQDYYYGVYDACEKFNCGIEGWHTESGPGVFEAVCLHPFWAIVRVFARCRG